MSPDDSNTTPSSRIPEPRRELTDSELAYWVNDPDWYGAFNGLIRPARRATGYYSIAYLCDPDCEQAHEHVTEPEPQYADGWEIRGPAGDDSWYWVAHWPAELARFVAATLASLITQQRQPAETHEQRRERWQREAPDEYARFMRHADRIVRNRQRLAARYGGAA